MTIQSTQTHIIWGKPGILEVSTKHLTEKKTLCAVTVNSQRCTFDWPFSVWSAAEETASAGIAQPFGETAIKRTARCLIKQHENNVLPLRALRKGERDKSAAGRQCCGQVFPAASAIPSFYLPLPLILPPLVFPLFVFVFSRQSRWNIFTVRPDAWAICICQRISIQKCIVRYEIRWCISNSSERQYIRNTMPLSMKEHTIIIKAPHIVDKWLW